MDYYPRKLSPRSLVLFFALLLCAGMILSIDARSLNASDGGTMQAQEAILAAEALYLATETARGFVEIMAGTPATKTKTPTPTRTPTPVNFGNLVWDDLDQDGRQDAGEPGLAGVTVQLWKNSQIIDSDTTDGNGIYSVQSPGPGNYRVRVVLPNINDQFSPKDNAAAGDLLDSDINPSGSSLGFTDVIAVASNVISITSIDAGIIKFRTATPTRTPTPVNIGNFVWDDLDQDGRQDGGEPGIAGVTVQLWNSDKSALLDSAVTNSSGNYTLTSPGPGQFRVRVVLQNMNDQFTVKDNVNAGDQLDSDFNPSGTNAGFTDIINIASNVISTTIIDAGIIKFRTATPTRTPTPINVGNRVWNDVDADGIQDGGEVGLTGITVQIWSSDRTFLIDTAITNANGNYTLVVPGPGDYRVRVLKPSGSSYSPKNAGADDLLDSDINTNILSLNFGFTDIYSFGSNLISITSIDSGLYNVPATPIPTATKTKTPTPTATLPPVSGIDTLAVYGKTDGKFSLIDSIADKPPISAYTIYSSNAPIKGAFVMGDWNADTQKTPGLFKDGFFWYTNQIGPNAVWSQVWTELTDGKFVLVAGRFSAVAPNDCFGLVQKDFVSPNEGFPLFYTCELGSLNPPSGMKEQWLGGAINASGKYQFVAGDFNGDGLDSIAMRRAGIFAWGDVAPSQGTATFLNLQDFGDPYDGYGMAVAGDWDGNGVDTFGLYFHTNPRLFYRNNLTPTFIAPARQRLKNKVGNKPFVDSWQEITEVRESDLIPVPNVPLQPPQPAITLTPSMTPTIIPDMFYTATPTAIQPTATMTVTAMPTDIPQATQPATLTPLPTFPPTRTEVPPEPDITATNVSR